MPPNFPQLFICQYCKCSCFANCVKSVETQELIIQLISCSQKDFRLCSNMHFCEIRCMQYTCKGDKISLQKYFVNKVAFYSSILIFPNFFFFFFYLVIWKVSTAAPEMTDIFLTCEQQNQFSIFLPTLSHPLSFQLSGHCSGCSLTATLQCRITLLLCLFPKP